MFIRNKVFKFLICMSSVMLQYKIVLHVKNLCLENRTKSANNKSFS